MMEYVVVPVLPKGALVEWQVYANVCRDKLDGTLRQVKQPVKETKCADVCRKWLPRQCDIDQRRFQSPSAIFYW